MRWHFALAALVLLSGGTARAEDCKLQRIASLDMKTDIVGGLSVPMSVQGKTVNMLIDTGGIYSMLTEGTVSSLDLTKRRIDLSRFQLRMIGNLLLKNYVSAEDVSLGGMHADRLDFVVVPSERLSADLGGTIAPDLLANFDVDFDMANAKLGLFSPDHCPGRVVYWTTSPVAIVPLRLNRFYQFDIDITLDGKPLRASVDTGSTRSWMSFETAKRLFEWADNDPRIKADRGNFRYPFSSLSFEGVSVNNPDIEMFKDSDIGDLGMSDKIILGMGILRQLHVYVAYHEKKLYLSGADAR